MTRGRRPITKRDWPFGARGRRELLEVVLADDFSEDGMTATELARRLGMSQNGSLDTHLAGLCQWKLLDREESGRFIRRVPMPELGLQLSELLRVVRSEPDEPLQPMQRRAYGSESRSVSSRGRAGA